jgi:hypothetical protein
MICYEVLVDESFKVNKLIRHLKTKDGSLADSGVLFLNEDWNRFEYWTWHSWVPPTKDNAAFVEALYLVAQRIALNTGRADTSLY